MIYFDVETDKDELTVIARLRDGTACDSLEMFPPEQYESGNYEENILYGFGILLDGIDSASLVRAARMCEVFFGGK